MMRRRIFVLASATAVVAVGAALLQNRIFGRENIIYWEEVAHTVSSLPRSAWSEMGPVADSASQDCVEVFLRTFPPESIGESGVYDVYFPQVKKILEDAIAQDFDKAAMVEVAGWMVSRTERCLAAILGN